MEYNAAKDQINKILRCSCNQSYIVQDDHIICRKCGDKHIYANGYINFFEHENQRPYWSMHMQNEFLNHGIELNMSRNYSSWNQYYIGNTTATDFFHKILDSGPVIIDLASGPSGYFGYLIENLKENQCFFITDGSPMIIDAHKKANQGNNQVGYIDLDLDKKLPFISNSIDCFTGRFLDNVVEQKQLITDIYRSLKVGGRYSVMELFFEDDSETSITMQNRNKITASLNAYLEFCYSVGFELESEGIIESYIGKLDPSDELPMNDKDKSNVIALNLIKRI